MRSSVKKMHVFFFQKHFLSMCFFKCHKSVNFRFFYNYIHDFFDFHDVSLVDEFLWLEINTGHTTLINVLCKQVIDFCCKISVSGCVVPSKYCKLLSMISTVRCYTLSFVFHAEVPSPFLLLLPLMVLRHNYIVVHKSILLEGAPPYTLCIQLCCINKAFLLLWYV